VVGVDPSFVLALHDRNSPLPAPFPRCAIRTHLFRPTGQFSCHLHDRLDGFRFLPRRLQATNLRPQRRRLEVPRRRHILRLLHHVAGRNTNGSRDLAPRYRMDQSRFDSEVHCASKAVHRGGTSFLRVPVGVRLAPLFPPTVTNPPFLSQST